MFYRGFVTSRSYSLSFLSLGRPVLSLMTPKTTPCATLLWQCKSLKITLHDTLFDPPCNRRKSLCHFQLFQRSNEKEISMSHHFLLPLQFLFITFLLISYLFLSTWDMHQIQQVVPYESLMKKTWNKLFVSGPKSRSAKDPPKKEVVR